MSDTYSTFPSKMDSNHLVVQSPNTAYAANAITFVPLGTAIAGYAVEADADITVGFRHILKRIRAHVTANSLNDDTEIGYRVNGVTVNSITISAGAVGEFQSDILHTIVNVDSKCNAIIQRLGTLGSITIAYFVFEIKT